MAAIEIPYHGTGRLALVARLGPHGHGGAVQWKLWLRTAEGGILDEISLQPWGEIPDDRFAAEIVAGLRGAGYRARRRAAPRAYWGAWTLDQAPIDVEA